MRVRRARQAGVDTHELREFNAWLLRLGEGSEAHTPDGMIALPTHRWPSICDPDGVDITRLRDWVYPGLFVGADASEEDLALQQSRMADAAWLGERTILAPRNRAVDELNSAMITAFPGDEMECVSADVVKEGTVATEFLNGIDLPNFPQHRLVLKRFMPLVLLRNLSPPDGLCNGTRLILLDVRHNGRLLVCRIATGTHVGQTVEIPRVTLDADEDAFPFKWSRRQFPVRAAFALTINKSQGQTFQCVGVYLPHPCFSHGQLYVAASRVGAPTHIRFAVPWDEESSTFRTRNVVFPEVLTQAH